MHKMLSLLYLLSLYSCASVSADWTPWKMDDVASVERIWRFCKAELDDPGYSPSDMCYQSEECRTKSVFIGKDKKECRRLTLHCAHGDVDCMANYGILDMKILNVK